MVDFLDGIFYVVLLVSMMCLLCWYEFFGLCCCIVLFVGCLLVWCLVCWFGTALWFVWLIGYLSICFVDCFCVIGWLIVTLILLCFGLEFMLFYVLIVIIDGRRLFSCLCLFGVLWSCI